MSDFESPTSADHLGTDREREYERESERDAVDTREPEEDEFEPFRDVPVGTNDPNIVGDAGPFDTPPGSDPHRSDDFDGA